MAVQWLGLCTSIAGAMGLTPREAEWAAPAPPAPPSPPPPNNNAYGTRKICRIERVSCFWLEGSCLLGSWDLVCPDNVSFGKMRLARKSERVRT